MHIPIVIISRSSNVSPTCLHINKKESVVNGSPPDSPSFFIFFYLVMNVLLNPAIVAALQTMETRQMYLTNPMVLV